MNRTLQFFLLAFHLGACLVFHAPTSVAQTQYAEVCRAELKLTTVGTYEHLLAELKLTEALRVHDLKLALDNADKALAIANRLGDSNAKTVAKLHRTLIRALLSGRKNAEADLRISDFSITENASPELRVHFRRAIIDFEIWTFSTEARISPVLARLNNDAKNCGDPHLVFQAKANEMYARMFGLGESPLSPEILALRKELEQGSARYPFLDCQIVLHLWESQAAKIEKDLARELSGLNVARRWANDLGNKFLAARCSHLIGFTHLRQREFEKSSDEFKRCLNVAIELSSEPLIYQSYMKLSGIERKRGNSNAVECYLKLAEKSPAFEDLSWQIRNSFFANLWSVNLELENVEQSKLARNRLVPPATVTAISKEHNADVARVQQQAEAEKTRLQQNHQMAESASTQTIAKLQKYLLFAILLIVFGLLLFVLFAIRNRLQRVSSQLDSANENVRQSNQERDDLSLRLSRMQRMESLGLMAGSVAHDFNNILVGVLGNAEIIQMNQGIPDQELIRKHVASIITSAEKAANLSHQMLAYAGKQQIIRKSTDLNGLIRQFAPVLRSCCQPEQKLEFRLADSRIVSRVDATQMEQVILNLVTNAVAASDRNGRITIETGLETVACIHEDRSLYGDRTTGGEFCYIEVRDEGQGVSPKDRERIFEPFYSKSAAGRGLGLSVVYGVVKGHDGLIRCQSEVGVSTSFRTLIPVCQEPWGVGASDRRQPDQRPQPKGFPQSAHGRTVLIIDDEESVLELCDQLMQINGWKVITALGGREGLEKASEFASQISCALVDVVMPEMGANELLQEFENLGFNFPVVLMSGFSQTKLEFFFKRPSVISIVQKPFHAAEIQQAVEDAAFCRATRQSTSDGKAA